MKKIFVFLTLFSLIFIGLNFNSFRIFYSISSWIDLYNNSWFNEWLKVFENIKKEQKNHENILNYNIANSYYKLWKYEKSIELYSKIKNSDKKLNFYKNHNLWNTYYKLWTFKNTDEEKIKLWKKSLENYKNALNIEINEDKKETQENYDYVKKKLDDLLKKQEEKEEQKKEQNQSWSWASQNQENSNEQQQNWEQESKKEIQDPSKIWAKNWTNWWQFNEIGEWQNEVKEFSQEEKMEVEFYLQDLKNLQKQNQQYLNNQKLPLSGNTFNDLLNQFREDPMFQDILPDSWNEEKDW